MVGKKPYGDWEIKEVFLKVLHQEFASLNELQTFNLNEFLEYIPLTNDEQKFFVGTIRTLNNTYIGNKKICLFII